MRCSTYNWHLADKGLLNTAEQQQQQQPPHLSMNDLGHRLVIILTILFDTNNTPGLSGLCFAHLAVDLWWVQYTVGALAAGEVLHMQMRQYECYTNLSTIIKAEDAYSCTPQQQRGEHPRALVSQHVTVIQQAVLLRKYNLFAVMLTSSYRGTRLTLILQTGQTEQSQSSLLLPVTGVLVLFCKPCS
jgi:hypothetical protein